jgi:ParB family chromosome partitioning protein
MSTPKQKSGLGKGLSALISNASTEVRSNIVQSVQNFSEIDIDKIEVNPFQPRADFNDNSMDELTQSIKLHGLIQPITVRMTQIGTFEIISGERRYRASRLAGLSKIPAYIRVANDQSMLEMALIENTHREDLNPIEVALSYQRLIEEINISQEVVAERVGKNRSTVSNFLRLLRLPAQIQLSIKNGEVSMGQARPLIGIENEEEQLDIFYRIVNESLSVRQVEELIKNFKQNPKSKSKKIKVKVDSSHLAPFVEQFEKKLDSKVKVVVSASGKGEITIQFKDNEDLLRISQLIDN